MRFQSRTTFFCSVACVAALLATSTFAAPDPTTNTQAVQAKLMLLGAQAQAPQTQSPTDAPLQNNEKPAASAIDIVGKTAALESLNAVRGSGAPEGPDTGAEICPGTPIGDGTLTGDLSLRLSEGLTTTCSGADTVDSWYDYTASCTGMATATTCAGATDTTLAVYGTCGGAEIACNDDACPGFASTVTWAVTAGNSYQVRVSGWNGGTPLYTLELSCINPGDTCAAALAATDGTQTGQTAVNRTDSGTVQSCGSTANPDEWWEYVATCSGSATADTLGTGDDTVLAVFSDCMGTETACNDDINFPPGESGVSFVTTAGNSYWIRVNGWGAGSTLASYNLNIACTALTAQGADTCAAGTVIGDGTFNDLDGTTAGTIDGATACAGTQSPDDWFNYVATCSGIVTVDTFGTGGDTILSVATDCIGTEIACNDDSGGLQSQVQFVSSGGNSYMIRVSGWGGATLGSYTLNVSCAIPGDECAAGHVIGEGTFAGETASKGASGIVTSCGSSSGNPIDEWWEYIPTCTGVATADTGGTGDDTVLGVFSDCAGTEILCDDDGLGFPPGESSGTWNVMAGNSYWIRVSGWGSGTLPSYALNVSCAVPVCGNDIIEIGEECDGTSLGDCADACVGCACSCGSSINTCAGTLSQSGSMLVTTGQIACGSGGNTTPNGWARCFDLAAEGVAAGEGVNIDSVTFGLSQATVDGVNYNINIYSAAGCPASFGTATLIHSEPLVLNMVDVGTLITTTFASPPQAVGGAIVVEIEAVDDGTVLTLATRPAANSLTDCGVSYLRAAACGATDWTDLTLFGFPDANLALQATTSCTVCGDGILDIDEQCDDGNTADGDCCSSTCQFESTATVCRADAGPCDVPEFCDGAGGCPADTLEPNNTVCGAAAGVCDLDDICINGNCIVIWVPSTTECRASAGICDTAESCTGSSADCPPDAFQPTTTECRADAGECDVAEFCDGAGNCPADSYEAMGTNCGDGPTLCSGQDTCDGAGTCNPNHDPTTVECRADAGDCDVPDFCDGAGNCPADAYEPFGTNCGAGPTECSDQDTCDGAGGCTNANDVMAGTPCGSAADTDCDNPDSCDGGGTCLDNFESSATVCRASVDECDPEETCDGLGACPDDFIIKTAIDDDGCCPPGLTILSDNDCPDLSIPTVSQWGMITLSGLLVVGLWIKFGRRETASA